jgi:UrcA family protein
MKHQTKGIAAAFLFMCMPLAPAAAGETQVAVSYSELNLDHQAGRDALMARLTHAADAVCGQTPSLNDLNGTQHHKLCVEAVMRQALAQVPRPLANHLALASSEN